MQVTDMLGGRSRILDGVGHGFVLGAADFGAEIKGLCGSVILPR